MRLALFITGLLLITGCEIAVPGKENQRSHSLSTSPLSHSPRTVGYEPNDTLSMDHLLAGRIKGKIKQALPNERVKVLVDGNRIIISSLNRENDEIVKQIRHSVGDLSNGRSLIVVSEEVYQLYDKGNKGGYTQ
ncbi:hypothetical protein FZW96_13075 [Bacillus sp. BGMRC 2118]|nr:hypothetical protein FZW96_13075 [Bacillus sp. BGMRC 2118]